MVKRQDGDVSRRAASPGRRQLDAVLSRLERPRLRFTLQSFLDAVVWALALIVAQFLRYEFDATLINPASTTVLVALTIAAQLVVGLSMRVYGGRYTYGSFEEVRALTLATTGVAILVFVPVLVWGNSFGIPRGTVPLALPMALVAMFAIRYVARLIREARMTATDAEPAIVFGAGYMGDTLIRRMLTDFRSPYYPEIGRAHV